MCLDQGSGHTRLLCVPPSGGQAKTPALKKNSSTAELRRHRSFFVYSAPGPSLALPRNGSRCTPLILLPRRRGRRSAVVLLALLPDVLRLSVHVSARVLRAMMRSVWLRAATAGSSSGGSIRMHTCTRQASCDAMRCLSMRTYACGVDSSRDADAPGSRCRTERR